MRQLIIETKIVEIATIIFGNISSLIVGRFLKVDLPPICKSWNKYYAMEVSLFLTGVIAHLFFEFTGLNKMYCRKGNACQ